MDTETSKVEETATNPAETEESNHSTGEPTAQGTNTPAPGEDGDGSKESVSSDDDSQEEQTDWQDRYLRLYAEFDNFRKRTMRERADLIRNASRDVLEQMLPILDDFSRAQSAASEAQDLEGWKEGQQLIHNKLKQVLKAQGVEAIEVNTGDAFDVDLHEAITRIPSPELSGKVVDVVEAGYKLNDTVIRYAKVVVGE